MKTRLWVALLGVVVGCGGGGGGAPGVDTNKDNVCSEIASVVCYDVYRCCAEGEIEGFLDVDEPRDEAACRSDVKRRCERGLVTELNSVELKRASFDATIMNACLESLVVGDDCATIEAKLPWAEVCAKTAWVGAVADGAYCEHQFECSSDSICSGSRLCKPKAAAGEPCTLGCKSGLFCNGVTCQAQVGAGTTCASSLECTPGLFCDLTATLPVCAAVRQTGETCTGDFACSSGKCLPGTCEGTTQGCFTTSNCSSHCQTSGGFCTTDVSCGLGTCSIGLNSCSSPVSCTAGAGDLCVFPEKCLPGACVGDVKCVDASVEVDYCKGPMSFPF